MKTRLSTLLVAGAVGLAACDGASPGEEGGSGGQGGSGGSGGQGASGGQGGASAIDECQDGTAVCSPDADCIDTPGFYECACKPGYEGDGKVCEDVDECQSLLDDCDPNAICTNAPGAFSCACPAGFGGDGKTCTPLYSSVAAGPFHACAVRQDGTIWCWGHNSSGQAGTGTTDNYFVRPVSIGDAKDWALVTAGSAFTCALSAAGGVSCWGTNSLGQLGDGTTTAKASPVPGAGGITDWITIDAGTNHACGVRADGSAHCWGRNNVGQLGDGTKDNNGDGTADNETSPVPVAGGGAWLSVSAGTDYSCGVRADHTLWCWGTNASRQLGDGTTTESAVPVQEKSLAADWASVDTGNAWTCALKQDGTRHCWGANNLGQGGDGTQTSIVEPKQVGPETDWALVRLGWEAGACGLRGAGEAWCWGDGSLGQSGQPGAEALLVSPAKVGDGADWVSLASGLRFACGVRATGELSCWGATSRGALASGFSGDRNEPTVATEHSDWATVEANTDGGCGLRGDKLFCWGRNVLSNLGDGTGITRPAPVPVGEALAWSAVSVGRFFGCGVTGGDIRCWGRDDLGQLGNGAGVTHSPSPEPLAATANASPWTAVAAGQDSACAIKQDQTLWCWGSDSLGQIGDGAGAVSQHVPKQVPTAGAQDWTQVSIARDTVCGLRGAGTLWCWGRNGDGQAATGAAGGNVASPTQVGAATYKAVSAGAFHACAVDTAGALWCWGRNTSGELGLGHSMSPVPSPTQVGSDTDWEAPHVRVGPHTCARKKTGDLYCWGAGAFGQIGQGGFASSNVPLKVPSALPWKHAAPGNEHTCGVQSDGRLFCWGASYSAQLAVGVPFLSEPAQVLDPL